MTVNEAITLANNGDKDAIRSLGSYYFEGDDKNSPDYFESLKWYTLGAEAGLPDCMYGSALLGLILGRTERKALGYDGIERSIQRLNTALFWARKATDNGIEKAKRQIGIISGELGIAHYFNGLKLSDDNNEKASEHFLKSINLLTPLYKSSDNIELSLYLAFSIHQFSRFKPCAYERLKLEHELLIKCLDNHIDEIGDNGKVAWFFLGLQHANGDGCGVDYDKAVYCFEKAHNAGMDCADILQRFKKTIFGGYKFMGW